ncbi:hypothetical protein BKA62DRAFT_626651 [Auriculariales sp. MPI-PUGE-AT-0066]|nr:hypothetical protein BKA62DRAFT_626651 [Auriculariales sp. MPI-PUGE-AT-0066]
MQTLVVRGSKYKQERQTTAELRPFAQLLAKVLSMAFNLEQLSIAHLPSVYHWVFANADLPKLQSIDLSVYLAINAKTFFQLHYKDIERLRLAPEPAFSGKLATKYHQYFDAENLPRFRKLEQLAVGLHFAPGFLASNSRRVRHLVLEDNGEPWHCQDDLAKLLSETFDLVATTQKLVSLSFKMHNDTTIQHLATLLENCVNLPLVMTLTLHACPWSDCNCGTRRVLSQDATAILVITSHFPDLTALRFACLGKSGMAVHNGVWATVSALESARAALPSVREIVYEDQGRGVSVFWHTYSASPGEVGPKNRHPFFVVPNLD